VWVGGVGGGSGSGGGSLEDEVGLTVCDNLL
jgi:hypothetical protein